MIIRVKMDAPEMIKNCGLLLNHRCPLISGVCKFLMCF